MDLFTLKDVSQIRFRELLQEAEHERLCRRVSRKPAGRQRLMTKAGDALIALGLRLKGQAHLNGQAPLQGQAHS